MNALDLFLLLLLLAYAVSGYWQGLITGAFATAGLLLGGIAGFLMSPHLLGDAGHSVWVSLGALFMVLISASFGQALLQFLGARIRDRIRWQPARAVDAVGGAVLSVGAVLVVTWVLGVAITGSHLPWVAGQVNNSRVLRQVNEVMPASALSVLHTFNDIVGASSLPRYMEPFARERIVSVAPPPARITSDPEVRAAAESVLKIHGENSCNGGVEGTGFLFQPDRLMTNAHVVAGVSSPEVLVGGDEVDAQVVYYNPDLDVAVLDVGDVGRPFLSFARGPADPHQPGAVLGFPEDGPYDAEGARIRDLQRLRSPDIYGDGTVLRDVYSVRSRIRPGNSGGPLVSVDGEVLGVVFAVSDNDSSTGYALTADAVRDAAFQGRQSTAEVSTGSCH